MTAKTIGIINQKGGVGKSTTTQNLGYSLTTIENKKVLLIDFDPQSSLTIISGFPEPDEIENTIAKLMKNSIEDIDIENKNDYIVKCNGFDLLPCNIELSAIEVSLVNILSREQILKNIVSLYKADYDYILIDCSPSLGMLTINALVASDSVIIPVTPDYVSAKGLQLLLTNVLRVKRKINPQIEIEGILLTRYDERTNQASEISTMIDEAYGSQIRIFDNLIPNSVKASEAGKKGMSVIQYKPNNPVALAYSALANELVGIHNK